MSKLTPWLAKATIRRKAVPVPMISHNHRFARATWTPSHRTRSAVGTRPLVSTVIASMCPEISVVIPTHDRPGSLATLMHSLAEQTLDPERFEVIVVDDASEARAETEVAAHGAGGLQVRLLRHSTARGPAAARNTGWRVAAAPLIALTDDDCRASAGWLSSMLEAATGVDLPIVQGKVEPEPDQRDTVGPLSHTLEVGGLSPFFLTCNIVYPRDLLERVSGFDETYRRACGEDVDLGARAVKAGGQPTFAENALVYHEVSHPGIIDLIRHTTKWSDGVRPLRRHPELREVLVARIFWRKTHVWLFLAAAGVAGGARTHRLWPGAAAALPYLRHYRRLYGGRTAWLEMLPKHLVIDVCEILTVAWGSIRHRTLML